MDRNKTGQNDDIPPESSLSCNEQQLTYTAGVATLRSSAHTLQYSKSRADDPGPKTTATLPDTIRNELIIEYDEAKHNLRREIIRILQSVDSDVIGGWNSSSENMEQKEEKEKDHPRLEDFCIPESSLLTKKMSKQILRRNPNRNIGEGKGEKSQQTLSNIVATDEAFLSAFDDFVTDFILPHLKSRLVDCNVIEPPQTNDDGDVVVEKDTIFYYQRPPTLRLQPGPSTQKVPTHRDADYGHQDGELNFWIPLTDPLITRVDIWAESSPDKDDYHPLGAKLGEIVSFHGSSCRHYVPPNPTHFTRVSLDFRVGVEGYFDPKWKMRGTKEDHYRRMVKL